MNSKRHFLSLNDITASELNALLQRAAYLKRLRSEGETHHFLAGKVLGMVFDKPSTRTRVSFEVGMFELGGHSVYLVPQGSQIARGEPVEDMARVLGRYCQVLMMRTFAQERLALLAKWANVPVINGLTDLLHPCQVVADLFTVWELRDDPWSLRYAWIGDGNNMANSWINAAGLLGLHLKLACPDGFDPDPRILQQAREKTSALGRGSIEVMRLPHEAVVDADVISTDVWASMGQESEAKHRAQEFANYCVDAKLVENAASDVVVLHCLPAHRGEEISNDVIEGPHSVVWQQAENRLHVQKAILELLLNPPS